MDMDVDIDADVEESSPSSSTSSEADLLIEDSIGEESESEVQQFELDQTEGEIQDVIGLETPMVVASSKKMKSWVCEHLDQCESNKLERLKLVGVSSVGREEILCIHAWANDPSNRLAQEYRS